MNQKKFYLLMPFLLALTSVFAQTNELLKVKSFKLDNGLTVFLNQDSSANKVFGAVMVNAGTKDESADATGMAHYLEHLMFKGTDKMGTSDFKKEKPFLDSISSLYEQLGKTIDEKYRAEIQLLINKQAVEASKYGMPTEFDKLLKSIGSTGLNAFTSYDMTFYHNSFPAHEMVKWLDIYSERFQNPVFRSFQSELEVVYEEKNRASDDWQRRIVEQMNILLFPNLPQGQWTGLGKTEHLKNPPLNKMYDFFYKHYVPENMALILSGNFKIEEAMPLIKEKFGILKQTNYKKNQLPELQKFESEKIVKKRMTPFNVGILSFQTVGEENPDRNVMDLCEYLLSNNAQTGFIDKVQLAGEMMYCGTVPLNYNDAGGLALFFVPKIFRQSLSSAEKKINAALDSLKQGNFTENVLDAAKNNLSKNFYMNLEDNINRGIMIGKAFNQGKTWEEYLNYPIELAKISREDVIRAANKYFGPNHLEFISKTGFPKKEKLKKPPYKAVTTDQKLKSEYAKNFESLPTMNFTPRFIDFQNDVKTIMLDGGHQIVAVKNQVNDLFYLQLRFKKGILQDPMLENAANLVNYCGAGDYKLSGLKEAFAKIACSYSVYAMDNYTVLNINGNEKSIDECIKLVSLVMHKPVAGDKSKSSVLNEIKTGEKMEKSNPSLMGRVLSEYGVFGDKSTYLTRPDYSEVKKMPVEQLLKLFTDITSSYQCEILYSGKLDGIKLGELIAKNLDLSKNAKAGNYEYPDYKVQSKPIIYLVNDKKVVQSQIYFNVIGEEIDLNKLAEKNAFNEYFGGGFSGLVLQEIREFRSLAYTAYGYYMLPSILGKKGRLSCYIGCQADKTTEAISTMLGLIQNMPEKADRIESLQKNLQLKVISDFPNFKQLPLLVTYYQRLGLKDDPNRETYEQYKNMQMGDIVNFYKQDIQNKPVIITIYGDKKRLDLNKLAKFGEIVEIKLKDIATY